MKVQRNEGHVRSMQMFMQKLSFLKIERNKVETSYVVYIFRIFFLLQTPEVV